MQKTRVLLTLAGCLAFPGISAQASDDDKNEVKALREEVAELRAALAEVTRAEDEQWLTEQRANEIRSLVHDVLADADTRASLLQSGMTAGYNKGFFIGSEDGNFKLQVGGRIQLRYIYNHRDGDPIGSNDTSGFEMRRVQFRMKGHVIDPSWQFVLNGAYSRSSGQFSLDEAEITKVLNDNWFIRAGQFKAPFLREELVSSSAQLAVERSLVNEEFNQDRSKGVEVGYENDQWRGWLMYGNGFGNRNTSWNELSPPSAYAVTARAELLGAGEWSQFKDLNGWSDDEFGWMIGAAFHWQRPHSGTNLDEDDAQYYTWTVDASVDLGGGASLFGYYVWRDIKALSNAQQGFVVEGGYFLNPDEHQVYVRYEYGDPGGNLNPDDNGTLSVITAGLNWYFAKNTAKWTTDVGYSFNRISPTWASSGAGYLIDAPGEDGQIVVRSQLQLLF